ncbi:MAG: MmcQ/YjbR family DNA-binding protein [Taibaiella sp.]|nr:MmcQ/YjbR family DNA-binding protein [Taibaiella sp.]
MKYILAFTIIFTLHMVTIKTFKEIALSFPEASEEPHFEKPSYRVNKKIFATLSEKDKRACLKFSEIDQSSFCSFDPTVIYPVPNKWGKQGWTFIMLSKVKREMLEDALTTAYCTVAPARLSKPISEQRDSALYYS